MKINNPFLIVGYLSPKYFCDREAETSALLSAIYNHRNVTLLSLRRMGKTGLIHHVFHLLGKQQDMSLFYVDIMPTTNLKEFINTFGNAVLGKLESSSGRILQKALHFFSNLRPRLSYDSITGAPTIDFNIQSEQEAEITMEQIFAYLKKQDRKIVIALDEFQQVINYPEKNAEAMLRANMQKATNVSFIFSGSHKHLLFSIFQDYNRPFYQSTEMMHLDKIEAMSYKQFIQHKFALGKRKIPDEVVESVLEWAHGHTFYVQYVCNKLYGMGIKNINQGVMNSVIQSILKENEVVYFNYRNLLTEMQFKLLQAIARGGEVDMPMSQEFIHQHGLHTPSSVKTALNALLSKEMIYEDNGIYQVYDVFLSRWLERFKIHS